MSYSKSLYWLQNHMIKESVERAAILIICPINAQVAQPYAAPNNG